MTANSLLVVIVFGKRVLKEGVYEAESVEDQLMATLYKVMKDVGRKKQ